MALRWNESNAYAEMPKHLLYIIYSVTATVWAIQASVSIGEASRTSYRYDLLNVINKSYALRCCSGEVRLLREVELLGQLRNVSY